MNWQWRAKCYGNVYQAESQDDFDALIGCLVRGDRVTAARWLEAQMRRARVVGRDMRQWIERFEARQLLKGGTPR